MTARGNRREPIFFENGDQENYCDLLSEQAHKAGVEIWAYCLMPNHVHLILCPTPENGLAQALGVAHRRWPNFVNAQGRWYGHLFDGRFAAVAMEEAPTARGRPLCGAQSRASAAGGAGAGLALVECRAQLKGEDDGLVTVAPVLDRVERFADLIETQPDDPAFAASRAADTRPRNRRLHRQPGAQAGPAHHPPRAGETACDQSRGPVRALLAPARGNGAPVPVWPQRPTHALVEFTMVLR